MPKKTKIIFIIVFILIGIIILGLYLTSNKGKNTNTKTPVSLYQKFNPFNSNKTTTTTNPDSKGDNTTTITNPNVVANTSNSKFHQITSFAVSGATFFNDTRPIQVKVVDTNSLTTPSLDTKNITANINDIKKIAANILPIKKDPTVEIVPSLRYVERSTGHIFQRYLDTGVEGKISNSTIPGVYEAIFNDTANTVIYRYVTPGENSITSFLANLGGQSNFLNPNIIQMTLSKDKTKFFSLIKKQDGVVGIIKSFGDGKSNQVFNSSFSEWLPQWILDQNIYLTTKPSYLVEGSIFNLNIKNGTLSKIFGGVKGLTTLASNDGNYILFGASTDAGPKLNIFDIKKHKSIDLDKFGLPEKCVWSNDNIYIYCAIPNIIEGNQYPDAWYQGTISFNDWFAKINTITMTTETIANSSTETPMDATNLFLSSKEDKLFFTNKKDSTLWSLDLSVSN